MDVETRPCIGSSRFGFEPHDAPVNEFPAQPSQKDGLGRMCRADWRRYTTALRQAADERKRVRPEADGETVAPPSAEPQATVARRGRRARTSELTGADGDAAPSVEPTSAAKARPARRSKAAEAEDARAVAEEGAAG